VTSKKGKKEFMKQEKLIGLKLSNLPFRVQ
jgi:hypothetical protein